MMKKKKLKPYMAPQCAIISMNDVPMLMSGSGPKPGANIGIDPWGKGKSDTPSSETTTDPSDADFEWLNKQP